MEREVRRDPKVGADPETRDGAGGGALVGSVREANHPGRGEAPGGARREHQADFPREVYAHQQRHVEICEDLVRLTAVVLAELVDLEGGIDRQVDPARFEEIPFDVAAERGHVADAGPDLPGIAQTEAQREGRRRRIDPGALRRGVVSGRSGNVEAPGFGRRRSLEVSRPYRSRRRIGVRVGAPEEDERARGQEPDSQSETITYLHERVRENAVAVA